jgi:glutaryl-CoA dehydrogenase (non-decarboxylating)
MISFQPSEEHILLRDTIRQFCADKVSPVIKDYDRSQKHIPWLYEELATLGLLGICIPEKYGGAGMDYLALGYACEELEYCDTSLRVVMSVHAGLNNCTLYQWGTEDQKQRYLVPQAKGEKLATYALTEPGVGSDPANMESRAVKDGSVYRVSGEKMWISLADTCDNFLFFAKTDPDKGHKGISCFIVEKSFEGVQSGTIHGKMGIRAGNTGWLRLDNCPVPQENLLGVVGEGFIIAMQALDCGRYTVAAGATGLIRACLDASVKYSQERFTFGKKIAEHQLVQEMIAKMARDYEIAHLLWLRAGWLKNQGKRNTRETSLAKWFACDASFAAASDAVQIHGAYGYSDEYEVERFLRNSKGAVIYEGTAQIHTLMQAGYALGLKEDKPIRCELPRYIAGE